MSDVHLVMFGCAVSFAALAGAYFFVRSQVLAVRRDRAAHRHLGDGRRLLRIAPESAMRQHTKTQNGRRANSTAPVKLYLVE